MDSRGRKWTHEGTHAGNARWRTGVSGVSGVKWVASFAPRSRVAIGDNVKIVVDMERVHWFDPETSEAIRG